MIIQYSLFALVFFIFYILLVICIIIVLFILLLSLIFLFIIIFFFLFLTIIIFLLKILFKKRSTVFRFKGVWWKISFYFCCFIMSWNWVSFDVLIIPLRRFLTYRSDVIILNYNRFWKVRLTLLCLNLRFLRGFLGLKFVLSVGIGAIDATLTLCDCIWFIKIVGSCALFFILGVVYIILLVF